MATEKLRIEILWFDGCPNHERADALVQQILDSRRLHAAIQSVKIESDAAARAARFAGAPTVRVNGVDVEPGFTDAGEYSFCCRLYLTQNGPRGLPDRR